MEQATILASPNFNIKIEPSLFLERRRRFTSLGVPPSLEEVERKREELKEDLGQRIGEKVERMEIGNVDLLRETAVIKVSYRGEDHSEYLDPTDGV